MKGIQVLTIALFALMLAWVIGRFASADPQIAQHSIWLMIGWAVLAILCLSPGKRALPLPMFGLALTALILVYGWFMTMNAKTFFEIVPQEYPDRFWKGGPGSMTHNASVPRMIEITGLILIFFAAAKSRQSRSWRLLLAVMPILGALITIVGLYHRVLQAPSVWFIDQRHPPTFFAPFVYNGHAGAYQNFAGAIGFGFWVSAWGRAHSAKTLGWGILAAMCFLGGLATASKGAALILMMTLGLSVLFHRRKLWMMWREYRDRPQGMKLESKIFAVGSVVLVLVFGAVGIQKLLVRMDDFIEDASDGSAGTVEGRKGIMKVMLNMSAPDEGGWFGFGPGSFATIVPFFRDSVDPPITGRWLHGHSDPLQLVTEWGYLGALLWATLAVGALVCGRKTIQATRDSSSKALTRGMIVALVSMSAHSCFDFPYGIISLKLVAIFVAGLLWGGVVAGNRAKIKE